MKIRTNLSSLDNKSYIFQAADFLEMGLASEEDCLELYYDGEKSPIEPNVGNAARLAKSIRREETRYDEEN